MTLEEFAREDMLMLRKLAARVGPPNIEELADMRLLDLAQRAMRDKLAPGRKRAHRWRRTLSAGASVRRQP